MFRGCGHLRMHLVGSSVTVRDTLSSSITMGMERRREAVEGGTHWNSLSLVYSTETSVYIMTCTVHGEVHNNDM